MSYLLRYPGGGQIALLVPGGASEALDSHPGTHVVQLKEKKGFIKVALQNGYEILLMMRQILLKIKKIACWSIKQFMRIQQISGLAPYYT